MELNHFCNQFFQSHKCFEILFSQKPNLNAWSSCVRTHTRMGRERKKHLFVGSIQTWFRLKLHSDRKWKSHRDKKTFQPHIRERKQCGPMAILPSVPLLAPLFTASSALGQRIFIVYYVPDIGTRYKIINKSRYGPCHSGKSRCWSNNHKPA